jgi:hypothetical protein
LWSVCENQAYTNCIFLGLPAVEASRTTPGTTNCIVAYGTGATPVITNCVMDRGRYGYTFNQTPGPPAPGINGGGNRTFANVAINTADFG